MYSLAEGAWRAAPPGVGAPARVSSGMGASLLLRLQRARLSSGGSAQCYRHAAAAPPAAASRRRRTLASAASTKRADASELASEVEKLKAENEALRTALAKYESQRNAPPGEAGAASTDPAAEPAASGAAAVAEVAAAAAGAPASGVGLLARLETGIKWPTPEEGNFWERAPRHTPLPLTPTPPSTAAAQRDPRSFHVVHITAEMAPCAKVGGLGDVVTGLARACLGRGHNVEIMLPVSVGLAALFCAWLLCGQGVGSLCCEPAAAFVGAASLLMYLC